jgi:hypothetical protein
MPKVEAILLAAIANMLVGALWYSEYLFGTMWRKLTRLRDREIKVAQGSAYRASFISALLMAYVMAYLFQFTKVETFGQAASAGVWLWVGFVFTTHLTTTFFGRRSLLLMMIDVGYFLMAMMVMGAVFLLFPSK